MLNIMLVIVNAILVVVFDHRFDTILVNLQLLMYEHHLWLDIIMLIYEHNCMVHHLANYLFGSIYITLKINHIPIIPIYHESPNMT